MDTTATQTAIRLAISGDWESAIVANLEILELNPHDIDSLNRLARAYAETGQIKKAIETAKKAIKIDSENNIAAKCIKKWKRIKEGERVNFTLTNTKESFLEDPGKTKLVLLVNPGDESVINKLDSGDKVFILCHSHKVSVVTEDKKYIGKLPDDVALKIRNLAKIGFEYTVLIKSVLGRDVKVFIRETKRPAKEDGTISFPTEKINYVSYTPPELVHKEEPDMEIPED